MTNDKRVPILEGFKSCCHALLIHEVTAFMCILEELTLFGATKISSSKMHCNLFVFGMWQLGFRHGLLGNRLVWDTYVGS